MTRHSQNTLLSDVLRFVASLRRYLVVGVIATCVDWALFSVFVLAMDWHYLSAGIVSFVVATFAGYVSGLRLLFRSGRHQRWIEIGFVYLVSVLGLAIHMGVLVALVEWLHVHLFLGKAVATGVAFLWNFSTRYFWIFDRDISSA